MVKVRPKFYKKGILRQTICLGYFPKLLKENLVYQSTYSVSVLFTEIEDHNCFELNIFHNNLTDNVYEKKFSQKYCRLTPELESIIDFFVG